MPDTPEPPSFWKEFFQDVVDDDLISLAAAISYYTTLCLSPLLLLSLVVLGALYPDAQDKFIASVAALVGRQGQQFIRAIVASANARPDLRQLAGWLGTALLLFGASAVFAQLQLSLDRVWGLQNKAYQGLTGWLHRRLLSAGVLLAVLFLTLVSFVAQAALNMLWLPQAVLVKALWWAASFLLYALLFMALYHWLPDGRVPWWTAFRGGLLTTALFMLGRAAIGLYLSRSNAAGAFGPAGAVVAWLLWAFYSALVFLLSAELLFSIARHRGWRWAEGGDLAVVAREDRPT